MFDKLSHFFLRRRNWTLPYALFLLIFAIVPLLLIVLYAFTDADGAFTFANFRKFMMHPEAMNTFIYSIGIALITTLTCLLLGYPAAYILSQKQFNYFADHGGAVHPAMSGEHTDTHTRHSGAVRLSEPAFGRRRTCVRHGLQLPAVHDIPHLQHSAENGPQPHRSRPRPRKPIPCRYSAK